MSEAWSNIKYTANKTMDNIGNMGRSIRDNSSIQFTIFTVITLGTFIHLMIDAFTSKYLEKEQGKTMAAVYIIGSFFSFVMGYFIFGAASNYIGNMMNDGMITSIIRWVLLISLLIILSMFFYFNNTLLLLTLLGSLFYMLSNKTFMYDDFDNSDYSLYLGTLFKNGLSKTQFQIMKVILFLIAYQIGYNYITNTSFSSFFDSDYKRVLSLSFWGNYFQFPLFLALLFIIYNSNIATDVINKLCDVVGVNDKLSIRTFLFVMTYAILDATLRGDDSAFRPKSFTEESDEEKEKKQNLVTSNEPTEITQVKCTCDYNNKVMTFNTTGFSDDIDSGLNKIRDNYNDLFTNDTSSSNKTKTKCTDKEAFNNGGVIATIVLVSLATYVAGGYTYQDYILPVFTIIYNKIRGNKNAQVVPLTSGGRKMKK